MAKEKTRNHKASRQGTKIRKAKNGDVRASAPQHNPITIAQERSSTDADCAFEILQKTKPTALLHP
jgi:hypothetical protein